MAVTLGEKGRLNKISIIIPIYNVPPDTFMVSVMSIYNQNNYDRENIEVVIVDDMSTKYSYKTLIDCLNKKMNIKYIKNKENVGAGVSRQIGIDNSHGEWICFLDADDFYSKDLYTTLLNLIEEYPDKEVFGWNIITEKSKKTFKTSQLVGSYAIKREFLERNNIKFHETLRIYEDLYFMDIVIYISIYENKFHRINKTLYVYLNNNQDSTLHRLGYNKDEMQFHCDVANTYKVFWFLKNKPELLEHVTEITNKFNEIIKVGSNRIDSK